MTVVRRLQTSASIRTEQGPRSHNDDACLAHGFGTGPWCGLFAVADGLGGHGGGAEAAACVIESLRGLIARVERDEWLEVVPAVREAVSRADTEIRRLQKTRPDFGSMGTTLTALVIQGDQGHAFHVGDSRLYGYRGGKVRQLTEDHTVAWRLHCEGALSREEYETSPMRNRLYRYLGGPGGGAVAHVRFQVRQKDGYLLATDGCLEGRDEVAWPADGGDGYNPQVLIDAMFDEDYRAAQQDNATAVALSVR